MKKIYATYRKKPLNDGAGLYTPSYFFDAMFEDYKQAGLTSIDDYSIDDSRYIGELVPGVLKKNRLLIGYYNDNYITEEQFRQSLITTGSEFHISLFDSIVEVKQRIRDNTDLEEVSDGVFKLNSDPEVLLTIE